MSKGEYVALWDADDCLPPIVIMDKKIMPSVGLFDEKYRVAEETEYFLRLINE